MSRSSTTPSSLGVPLYATQDAVFIVLKGVHDSVAVGVRFQALDLPFGIQVNDPIIPAVAVGILPNNTTLRPLPRFPESQEPGTGGSE